MGIKHINISKYPFIGYYVSYMSIPGVKISTLEYSKNLVARFLWY